MNAQLPSNLKRRTPIITRSLLAATLLLVALLAIRRPASADHEPTFIEFSTGGEVFAFNFTHDADLTFTIYNEGGAEVAVEPVTADENGFAELWHDVWHGGTGPAVMPGYRAEVTDGVYTREVILADVLIDTYRIDDNSLAGRAPAGETVTVRIGDADTDLVELVTTADGDGRWALGVDPLVADLSDPGLHAEAIIHDEDGDSSFDVYQLPPSTCANMNVYVTYFGAQTEPEGFGFEVFVRSLIDPHGLQPILYANGVELQYDEYFVEGFNPDHGHYDMTIVGTYVDAPILGDYEVILQQDDNTLRAPCAPEVVGDYRAHVVDLQDIPAGAPEMISPLHLTPVEVDELTTIEWEPFTGSYNGTAIESEGYFAALDLDGQFFVTGLDGETTSASIADLIDEETGESPPNPLPPGIHTFVAAAGYNAAPDLTFEHHRVTVAILYDPDSGFVTGGGHFDATLNEITGRANIGFVAKYKKGSRYPKGQVQFNFQEAGLNFHSEQLHVLVIDGDRAWISGNGRLNGESGYGFDLEVVDGRLTPNGEDMVRMVIFAPDGSGPVYASDSPGEHTALQGSVVIHTK